MTVAEQTPVTGLVFELTKPVQYSFVGTMKLIINFVDSGLDSECVTSVMSSQSHALKL